MHTALPPFCTYLHAQSKLFSPGSNRCPIDPADLFPCLRWRRLHKASLAGESIGNQRCVPDLLIHRSMVKVFQDLLWTACWLVSGDFLVATHSKHHHGHDVHVWTSTFWYKSVAIPLVCCFPLFVRFNQCLRKYMDTRKAMPNLANALKYAMSQCVTLFGAFHPLYLMHNRRDQYNISMNDEGSLVLSDQPRFNFFEVFWMGLFISSSLYSFWWDVYMGKYKIIGCASCFWSSHSHHMEDWVRRVFENISTFLQHPS